MSARATRLLGAAFAVTILISEVLKGDSPSPTGPATEIVSIFTDRRTPILAGAYVQMLALFLLALFSPPMQIRSCPKTRSRDD